MSKITYEKKRGKITITNRLSYPETMNERVFNAIASGMFEGFLPMSVRQKRKETRIECVIQGLIPLNEYFEGVVTKKMFLDFVHEIALLIKSCEKNMINANNLDLQSDKIFIEPQTKKVKCIFWPVVNNQRSNPPHYFLKELPYELNFNQYDDNDFLETYKNFFDGLNPFSVNAFDRMIMKLSGKNSETGRTTPSELLSGMLMAKTEKKELEAKKINREYNPFSNSFGYDEEENKIESRGEFCTSCGSKNQLEANYCISCGAKINQERQNIKSNLEFWNVATESGTTVLETDSGGTTVLGYDEPEEFIYPKITCLRTVESKLVDKVQFRIGTGRNCCDYYIDDNTYISKNHADIVTKDNRYYIVDRHSTNKTYVDGKVIPAETEIEIFSGTKIRLANEEFIFSEE